MPIPGRRDARHRGASLLTFLTLSALIFTLVVALVGAAFHHLHLSGYAANAQQAQNLADSAISKAIEQVLVGEEQTGDLRYGIDQTQTVLVQPDPDAQAWGVASFDPSYLSEHDLALPQSLNNLQSDSATTTVQGALVPAGALYLAGYGISGGVERRVEAIIHLPRFPYSLAAQGPVRGQDVFVSGLADGATLTLGADPRPEDLRPGSLASNSTSGDLAVELTGQSKVKGDLKSASGARVGAESVVEGALKLYADPTTLPQVPLESYRPDPADPDVNRSLSSLESNLQLSGSAYYDGNSPLNILNGLTLNGGVLFVQGDLTVRGGISGKGAVIATGNISVEGGGSVATDNLAALLSGGDLTIDGGTPDARAAVFEGLVYAQGNLRARNVSLVGTAISHGAAGSELENARFYERPAHGQVAFEPDPGQAATPPGPDPNRTPYGPVEVNRSVQDEGSSTWSSVWKMQPVATRVHASPKFPQWGLYYNIDGLSFAEITSRVEHMLNRPLSAYERTRIQHAVDNHFKIMTLKDSSRNLTFEELRADAQLLAQTPPAAPVGNSARFSLDLAEFLSPLDRMKVLLWRSI